MVKTYSFYEEYQYDISAHLGDMKEVTCLSSESSYTVNPVVHLKKYLSFKQYNPHHAVAFYKDGVIHVKQKIEGSDSSSDDDPIKIGKKSNRYVITFWGSNEKLFNDLKSKLDAYVQPDSTMITWAYTRSNQMTTLILPLKDHGPVYQEAYPYIKDVKGTMDAFMESSASILIMNGPMGTGKTSLIADLITRHSLNAVTTYDTDLMKDDSFYVSFLSGENNLMIMEDADVLLLSREASKNETIAKLLNVSDGIVNSSKKKIIITANANNVADFDPAIMRPGRCYGVIPFRKLVGKEVDEACRVLNKPRPGDKKDYALAEIFNGELKEQGFKTGFA